MSTDTMEMKRLEDKIDEANCKLDILSGSVFKKSEPIKPIESEPVISPEYSFSFPLYEDLSGDEDPTAIKIAREALEKLSKLTVAPGTFQLFTQYNEKHSRVYFTTNGNFYGFSDTEKGERFYMPLVSKRYTRKEINNFLSLFNATSILFKHRIVTLVNPTISENRAGIKKILVVMFYNLTDEEKSFLDTLPFVK